MNNTNHALPFETARKIDWTVSRLQLDLDWLLNYVEDARSDQPGIHELRHLSSHLKAAAARLERAQPYARKILNDSCVEG